MRNFQKSVLIFFALICLAGCASKVEEKPADYNYFQDLSTDNRFYAFIPVQTNVQIVKKFLTNFDQSLSEQAIDMLIKRSNAIYVGSTTKSKSKIMQAIVCGDYPQGIMQSSLKKEGWTKYGDYFSNGKYNLKFYDKNSIVISNGDVHKVDASNKNTFAALNKTNIEFITDDPLNFLHVIVGDIELPISTMRGVVTNYTENELRMDVDLTFIDERGVKPAAMIVSRFFLNQSVEQKDKNILSIKGMNIKSSKMEGIWTLK